MISIFFQKQYFSVPNRTYTCSSAEDLYKLQDFPVLCQSQLNLLNQQKKVRWHPILDRPSRVEDHKDQFNLSNKKDYP